MNYSSDQSLIKDIIIKNEIDKLLDIIKEKIGKITYENIIRDVFAISKITNEMAE